MRTMLIAAAALNLGVGAAYAGDDEGRVAVAANSQLPDTSGEVVQVSAQNASPVAATAHPPVVATAQGRQVILLYVTSSSQGTWLFAPNQNEGTNN